MTLADAPQFDIQAALNAWAADPVKFVRDNFGVEPQPFQVEALENYVKNPRLAMKASKGVGKTCVMAWCVWHFLATRPFCKIACVAIDGKNLRDNLWSELALWRSRSEYLTKMFDQNSEQIRFRAAPAGTWFCSARTWSKSADANAQSNTLAGLHADNIMFVLDETGGMPSAIMASAENALSSAKEGHIIQAGNPTHLSGPLYDACTRQRRLWYVVTINADPDNPKRSTIVPAKWAREQIELYGRDNPWIKVNVFGEFPPASINSLIGVDEVEAAMKRMWRADELRADPRILGVDVARFGGDASVICRRQGLQVWPFTKYRNIDGVQGAGVVARIWRDWQADACFLDGTGGWATSWEDQLRRMRYSPVSIPFSAQAHDPGKFFKKRTEMYWDAIEWIKRGGALPNDPELLAQLTQTTYSFKGDKIILEDKDMIKVKLGYSPDSADAFVLTFAEPVSRAQAPLSSVSQMNNRHHKAYNPFRESDGDGYGGTHYE